MGNSNVAAATAALLCSVLFAILLAASSSLSGEQAETRTDETGLYGVRTGHDLQGQAWATELFGRRYGRNLLAAVAPDGRGSEVGA